MLIVWRVLAIVEHATEAALPKERLFDLEDPLALLVLHQVGSGEQKKCISSWEGVGIDGVGKER